MQHCKIFFLEKEYILDCLRMYQSFFSQSQVSVNVEFVDSIFHGVGHWISKYALHISVCTELKRLHAWDKCTPHALEPASSCFNTYIATNNFYKVLWQEGGISSACATCEMWVITEDKVSYCWVNELVSYRVDRKECNPGLPFEKCRCMKSDFLYFIRQTCPLQIFIKFVEIR